MSEMEIFSYIDQLSGVEKDELIIDIRKNRFLEDMENRSSREIPENYCDTYGFEELIYYLAELSGEYDDE